MTKSSIATILSAAVGLVSLTGVSLAQDQSQTAAPRTSNTGASPTCPVNHDQLADILKKSVKPSGGPSNGGLDNNEWAAVVNRQGIVCAVAYSGNNVDDQWLGSRAIAAEKANTSNAFSLKDKAMATANLYSAAQPGGFLFGGALSNPASPEVLYSGDPGDYGGASDPMLGKQSGGVIVFGGGLALYDDKGIVGALGVSGDSACADHNVAWRVRHLLALDHVRAGVSPNMKDAIIYDIGPDGKSASGFGHPKCVGREDQIAVDLGAGVNGNAVR
jgi:uncharacterized protein GlcG (DUF336 family)